MKNFAYFNVSHETAFHPENATSNNITNYLAERLAAMLADANPAHSVAYYRDRIVSCDFENARAVTCIANSGESKYNLGHHNVFMDSGADYLYSANGQLILVNASDDYDNFYFRVHSLDYSNTFVFPAVPNRDYRMGQQLVEFMKTNKYITLYALKDGMYPYLDAELEQWVYEQFAKVVWSNPDLELRVGQLRRMENMRILRGLSIDRHGKNGYRFTYGAGQDYPSEIRFIQNQANKC